MRSDEAALTEILASSVTVLWPISLEGRNQAEYIRFLASTMIETREQLKQVCDEQGCKQELGRTFSRS